MSSPNVTSIKKEKNEDGLKQHEEGGWLSWESQIMNMKALGSQD